MEGLSEADWSADLKQIQEYLGELGDDSQQCWNGKPTGNGAKEITEKHERSKEDPISKGDEQGVVNYIHIPDDEYNEAADEEAESEDHLKNEMPEGVADHELSYLYGSVGVCDSAKLANVSAPRIDRFSVNGVTSQSNRSPGRHSPVLTRVDGGSGESKNRAELKWTRRPSRMPVARRRDVDGWTTHTEEQSTSYAAEQDSQTDEIQAGDPPSKEQYERRSDAVCGSWSILNEGEPSTHIAWTSEDVLRSLGSLVEELPLNEEDGGHNRRKYRSRDTTLGSTINGINLRRIHLCEIHPDGSATIQLQNARFEQWMNTEIEFDENSPVRLIERNRWYAVATPDNSVLYVQRAQVSQVERNLDSDEITMSFPDEGFDRRVRRRWIFEIANYDVIANFKPLGLNVSVVGLTGEGYSERDIDHLQRQWSRYETFYAIPISEKHGLRVTILDRRGRALTMRK